MARSRGRHRQLNIPQGSYLQEEMVNPSGTEEVPSFPPAQTRKLTREADSNYLMERVISRKNLLSALRRAEKNKGAAGVDGMEIKSLRPYLLDHWPV